MGLPDKLSITIYDCHKWHLYRTGIFIIDLIFPLGSFLGFIDFSVHQ